MSDTVWILDILGRNTVKSVEKYNPTTDTWCEVSPMLTPRRGLGAAILDGILYVVGGSDGIAAVNQVNLFFRYLAIAIFQKLYASRHSSSQNRPLFDNSHKQPTINVKT